MLFLRFGWNPLLLMMFAIVTDTMDLVALVMLAQGVLLITALVAPLMTVLAVTATQAQVDLAMMAQVAPRTMALAVLFTAVLVALPITDQAALVMMVQVAPPITAQAVHAIQAPAAMVDDAQAFADSCV